MKKIRLVQMRGGKPALHWPGMLLFFAVMMLLSATIKAVLDWILFAVLPGDDVRSLWSTIRWALGASVLFVPLMSWIAWQSEKNKESTPAPDGGVQAGKK